jgi:hypothetical protein
MTSFHRDGIRKRFPMEVNTIEGKFARYLRTVTGVEDQ